MKKLKLMGILLLSTLVLGACSSNKEKNSTDGGVSVSKNKKTTESSTKNSKKTSEVGKRSNPVKFGDTATFPETFYDTADSKQYKGEIAVTLLETNRGDSAWAKISAENSYNKQAPEGYEWVLVKAKLTITDLENDDVKYHIYNPFKPFDSNGQSIDQQDSYVSLPSPEFSGEIFNGGTIEGYFAFIAKTDEDVILEFRGNSADYFFEIA